MVTTGWNDFFYFRFLAPIILITPLPPLIKVILTYLTDMVDCRVYKALVDPTYDSKYYEYQSYDKLLDLYTTAIIVFYIISLKIVDRIFFYPIIALFILRMVGTVMFVISNRTIYLKIFADGIREFIIYILAIEYFPKILEFTKKNVIMIATLIYAIKAVFECYWHKDKSYEVFDPNIHTFI